MPKSEKINLPVCHYRIKKRDGELLETPAFKGGVYEPALEGLPNAYWFVRITGHETWTDATEPTEPVNGEREWVQYADFESFAEGNITLENYAYTGEKASHTCAMAAKICFVVLRPIANTNLPVAFTTAKGPWSVEETQGSVWDTVLAGTFYLKPEKTKRIAIAGKVCTAGFFGLNPPAETDFEDAGAFIAALFREGNIVDVTTINGEVTDNSDENAFLDVDLEEAADLPVYADSVCEYWPFVKFSANGIAEIDAPQA